MSQKLVLDLTQTLLRAGEDEGIRVIVLTGEGSAFSAGADLDSLRELQTASREDNVHDSETLVALFRSIYENAKPVIARVNGHAIAGGCGLAAACDIAIGVEEARFGFPEVCLGFVPAIVSAILVRRLSGAHLRRLFLTGELITAAEAAQIGLIDRAVVAADLDRVVDDVARTLSTKVSSEALALTKELLIRVPSMSLEEALDYGARLNVRARETSDCRAGVAAFLEKKDPPWSASQ